MTLFGICYIYRFGTPGEKAAKTETLTPGVFADFDRKGRLIGIDVLDASKVLDQKVQLEIPCGLATGFPYPLSLIGEGRGEVR